MSWPSWLPANRVAAIAAFLTAIAAAIAEATKTLPQTWQATTTTIVTVIGAVATALHFMLGSQKDDRNQANIAIAEATANYVPPADYRPPFALKPETH